jgi:hypothetical protein
MSALHMPAVYRVAIRLKPDDWTPLVGLMMAAGDEAGLRRVSSDLLKWFGTARDRAFANRVSWLCSIIPIATRPPEYDRLRPVSGRAMRGGHPPPGGRDPGRGLSRPS